MAVLGSGSAVKDVYTDSTLEVGVRAVTSGSIFKADSEGRIVPRDPILTKEVGRTLADYAEVNYTNPSSTGWGNFTLPDGRVLIPLNHTTVPAWKVIICASDGITRLGTNELSITPPNSNVSPDAGGIVLTQLGESSDGTKWIMAYGCKGYYSNGYNYAEAGFIWVSKTDNTMGFGTEYTSQGAPSWPYAGSPGQYAGFTDKNIYDRHVCRGSTVFANFVQTLTTTAAATYTLSTRLIGGTYGVTLSGTTYTTTFVHVPYQTSLAIIPIDDANGIFLVGHETVTGTYVLTKVEIASDAQITTTVVATMDAAYTDFDTAISRSNVLLAGYGDAGASPNLCFFEPASNTSIRLQTCTYDSSDDSLTWGTYQLVDFPENNALYSYGLIRLNRSTWVYSPHYRSIYICYPSTDLPTGGTGVALNIDTGVISAADLIHSEGTTYTQGVTISPDGTEIMTYRPHQNTRYRRAHISGVDHGLLVTSSSVAVALEDKVFGDTINVALEKGAASQSVLPATTFFAKENLYWPYVLYNEDGSEIPQTAVDANIIKSIQRGYTTGTYSTDTTINSVDVSKSVIHLNSSYHNSLSTTRGAHAQLTNSTTITVGHAYNSSISLYWEVIEYV